MARRRSRRGPVEPARARVVARDPSSRLAVMRLARPEVHPRPLVPARCACASGGDAALCVGGASRRQQTSSGEAPDVPASVGAGPRDRSVGGRENSRDHPPARTGPDRERCGVHGREGATAAVAAPRGSRARSSAREGPLRGGTLDLSAAPATSSDGGTRGHLTCMAGRPEGRAGGVSGAGRRFVASAAPGGRVEPEQRRPIRKRRNLRNGRARRRRERRLGAASRCSRVSGVARARQLHDATGSEGRSHSSRKLAGRPSSNTISGSSHAVSRVDEGGRRAGITLQPGPTVRGSVRGRRRGRTTVAGGAAAARDRARRAPSGRAVARGGRVCVGGGVGPRRAFNAAWLAVSGSDRVGRASERAERAELAEGR